MTKKITHTKYSIGNHTRFIIVRLGVKQNAIFMFQKNCDKILRLDKLFGQRYAQYYVRDHYHVINYNPMQDKSEKTKARWKPFYDFSKDLYDGKIWEKDRYIIVEDLFENSILKKEVGYANI